MGNKVIFSAAIAVGMMVSSCHKDGTKDLNPNNGQATMSVQMKATNTAGRPNQRTTANGLLEWTSGYANPREVKFEAKQEDLKIEYTSTSKEQIDLFAPVPLDFGAFMLPEGDYKEIELKVKLGNNQSDEALHLEGTYTNNGLVTPVVFDVEENMVIKTELEDVTIDNTAPVAALLDLDLASYLNGVSDYMLQNAKLTNGVIVISRNSNKTLYNIMTHNLVEKRHKCKYKKNH